MKNISFVPIIFSGPGMTAGNIHQGVHPVDVAPAIAAGLGMTPPGSAQGSVLAAVLEKTRRLTRTVFLIVPPDMMLYDIILHANPVVV